MPKKFNDALLHYEPLDDWDESKAKAKLAELYQSSLKLADSTIKWYHDYRKKKGNCSKTIRLISICMLIASTLMPYFSSIFQDFSITFLYVGYILAGIGGGLLLLDRYYGFSNSWIRFVLTGMDLENLRNSFVETWQVIYLKNLPLTIISFEKLVDTISKFQEAFHRIQKIETEAWAKEFQQSFKELIAALKLQSDQIKTELEEKEDILKQKTNELTKEDVPLAVVREAIDANYDNWTPVFKVVAISPGIKIKGEKDTGINCIVFSPAEKIETGDRLFTEIPSTIHFRSVNGKSYEIPTDVQPAGSEIRASSPALLCDNTVPKRPGCSISRARNQSAGTLGLKVFKNGSPYILSCFHVLCSSELEIGHTNFTPENSIGDTHIVSPAIGDTPQSIILGEVVEGVLSEEIDAALALITDDGNVTTRICNMEKPPSTIPLLINDEHARKRFAVTSVGRTSGVMDGAIRFAYTNCDVNYFIHDRWKIKHLKGLICTNQSSDSGDSGAPVVDKENNVIGIIVASSINFTYIIPIQRIISKFSITLQ